jgi:extracellular matrix regulatory protein A
MSTELVHVGFGNILAMDKVLAIVSPGSAPIKRMIQAGKSKSLLIDLTSGRKTKAVIIMDSGHIVLVALNAETIAGRLAASRSGEVKQSELGEGE